MKRVIKFLPALAILLASGLAIATTKKMNEPNVYWDGEEWLPLTINQDQYTCPGTGQCTGHWNGVQVIDIEDGVFTPRPNN